MTGRDRETLLDKIPSLPFFVARCLSCLLSHYRNEDKTSSEAAKWRRRQTAKNRQREQTDRQTDRETASNSSSIIESRTQVSKMTKLISSPDRGLESFGLSMATDAAGTRQQQQGLLSN